MSGDRTIKGRAGGLRFVAGPSGVTVERDLSASQAEWLGVIGWPQLRKLLDWEPPPDPEKRK
jgi:hypothetical protein